ncbi:MAG: 4-hydroxy-tetrahydrodipicolinate synthase [Candidatus Thorarchaeota archaeon]|nr:MAG: 4-hydroxy-tetrahydrodipicolinate synthase [Candidatus Thorarchaeota archaeon]
MTKRFVPQGVLPALVTPFTKDGDLIEEGFKQIIDYTIENGATGLVPAGTTGEFLYMRTEERKKLLKLTVELAEDRVPVIAGTGQNSTRATVALTKYAADIGCAAALVVSPYFLRPEDKGYFEHYAEVARRGDLPVILYNIPQCTLGILQSNVVEDLAELDNIVAIKDSSGSIPHVLELIEKLRGKMPVLIGHDECFLSAVAAGATAAIMASGNIMPHIWLEIMKNIRNGNIEKAAELQLSVQTLSRIITRHGGAPPVKAALRMMGMNAGRARMPLNSGGTLTWELREEIRLELEKLGLIDELSHAPVMDDVDVIGLIDRSGVDSSRFENVKRSIGAFESVSTDIILGKKDGPVGEAFVKLMMNPQVGHEALSVILEPNLAVRPSAIMMPARKIKSMRQASLFYGPVQSGAAKAVARLVASGRIPSSDFDDSLMIMAVDIDLNLRDRRTATSHTERAVTKALEQLWR